MRTAHSAGARGLVGADQRAKNGAAKSDATRKSPSSLANERRARTTPGSSASRRASGSWGAQAGGCLDHAGHEDVFEVVGLAHGHRQRGEEPGHLGLDDAGKDGVLPAGEGPIQRGPRDTRFSRDVVRGRLLQALGTDAAQRRTTIRTRWELRSSPPRRTTLATAAQWAPSGRAPSIRRRRRHRCDTMARSVSMSTTRGIQRTGAGASPPAARRARGGPAGRVGEVPATGDVMCESAIGEESAASATSTPGRLVALQVGTELAIAPRIWSPRLWGRLEQLGSVARMRWRTAWPTTAWWANPIHAPKPPRASGRLGPRRRAGRRSGRTRSRRPRR